MSKSRESIYVEIQKELLGELSDAHNYLTQIDVGLTNKPLIDRIESLYIRYRAAIQVLEDSGRSRKSVESEITRLYQQVARKLGYED